MKLTIRIESEEGDGAWPMWKFETVVPDLEPVELPEQSHRHLLTILQAAHRATVGEPHKILKAQ
jgi:hypothetical protein